MQPWTSARRLANRAIAAAEATLRRNWRRALQVREQFELREEALHLHRRDDGNCGNKWGQIRPTRAWEVADLPSLVCEQEATN